MWYTATSASVTNGATVVAITTGDDISIIQEDGGLIFEGESPVQIKRGYIDGGGNKFIKLQSPWPYTNKTNQPLVSFPTDASFAEATAELRRVVDTLSVASTVEAQAGTDDEKIMTPLKTKQAFSSQTGTAATRDVTTSPTDTTVARLLKVGDFGIGGGGSLDIPNAIGSTQNVGGQYRTIGTTEGVFPSGVTRFGYVRIEKYDGSNLLESSTPINSDRFFKRRVAAGEPQPWVEMYHSGNTNFNEFVFNQNETKNGIARNGNEVVIELPINSKVDPTSISATGTFYVVNSITSVTEATGVAPTIIGASSQRNLIVVLSSSGSFTKGDPYTVVAEAGGVTIEANY